MADWKKMFIAINNVIIPYLSIYRSIHVFIHHWKIEGETRTLERWFIWGTQRHYLIIFQLHLCNFPLMLEFSYLGLRLSCDDSLQVQHFNPEAAFSISLYIMNRGCCFPLINCNIEGESENGPPLGFLHSDKSPTLKSKIFSVKMIPTSIYSLYLFRFFFSSSGKQLCQI